MFIQLQLFIRISTLVVFLELVMNLAAELSTSCALSLVFAEVLPQMQIA